MMLLFYQPISLWSYTDARNFLKNNLFWMKMFCLIPISGIMNSKVFCLVLKEDACFGIGCSFWCGKDIIVHFINDGRLNPFMPVPLKMA